jgi:hypothetical protein
MKYNLKMGVTLKGRRGRDSERLIAKANLEIYI